MCTWLCCFAVLALSAVLIEHQRRLFEARVETHTPLVLFDGVCALCNGFVDACMQLAPNQSPTKPFKFAPLQSRVGQKWLSACGLDAHDLSSVVLVEESQCYRQSDAALRVIARFAWPWPLLHHAFIGVPRGVRDAVYALVARTRYDVFGKWDQCRAPTADDADWFEQENAVDGLQQESGGGD